MYVIGTAGHVDHGKSTLVQALTGMNPDRLKEELDRQMTIDLGFAWFDLPNGETVGVVDVPGHRDFIENMLAGVGGIDAALFVIAADEGVMPQTREHLAILDLLQVGAGAIALTKADLVDEEWRELVMADVAEAVAGTVLEQAPMLPVSARTGAGLPELVEALQAVLAGCPPRPDMGRPRLPIDRVFNLPGFGTIVTGTLSDGSLALGEAVELQPVGLTARVRGLQTHKTKIEQAVPGSRVAVNLAGVETSQILRGMVLTHPDTLRPTTHIDARFHHLPDAELPLKHNAQVKFFVGAAEVVATLRLLDHDVLAPGETAWVQLALVEPVVVVKGDRFILRRPSPGATIGGGLVVDPHPKRRHRRRDPGILSRLETLAKGAPDEVLRQTLDALGPAALAEAVAKAGLDRDAAREAVAALRAAGYLIELEKETLVVSQGVWRKFEHEIDRLLSAYHAANPLRSGMPREELKSRLNLSPKVFNAVLARVVAMQRAVAIGAAVRRADHAVAFTPAQQKQVEALLADFRREPYNTPSVKDCAARVGDEVLNALIEQSALVQISPDVLLLSETYAATVERIKAHIQSAGQITVAEARDLFSTSRKYALAVLEYLDETGVTRRVDDYRVLRG